MNYLKIKIFHYQHGPIILQVILAKTYKMYLTGYIHYYFNVLLSP